MSTAENSEDKRTLLDYCERFSELRVNKPHQPILLLSVIDLIAEGLINQNRIEISEQLENQFNYNWEIFKIQEGVPGSHYPFTALEAHKFWHVQYNEDEKKRLQQQIKNRPKPEHRNRKPQAKDFNGLKKLVEYAYLDEELFELLQDSENRKKIVDTLISVWFYNSDDIRQDLLNTHRSFEENANNGEDEVKKPKIRWNKSSGRDALFRKTVVDVYDYRCAFCGLKVTRKITQSIVDGAHIKPFAKFYDNSIGNGISFCKNHHWAFDWGWFTIDDDYKIVVANDLQEVSPNAKSMREFHGEHIALPTLEQDFPRLDALDWHRKNIFRV
ncbi:HNH endonuclease [Limnoraphis robusta]|uniref:HNH endonuclease n=1 Tax=Limnoraphis robusta CCNP1315 TaxID=3110306 RepID=A0ABU5U787_9CYAN|nr:HNH endonuclease [Limnoraphis robusta]MEA5523036.1 HNH endonuclease [Limnoraphis robusta CCNP1315]MEA5546888.1 HNH endonuclease [Limnoraphis robusta CCNP1324]